jgi:thiamine biosynthesis lipoprotein
MAVAEASFRVMASECRVIAVDADRHLLDDAARHLDHLEERWSRFLPGSDITLLNHHPDQAVRVAPETLTLVATMIDGWRVTAGRYDPSTLPALIASGYGASIVDPQSVTTLPPNTSAPPDALGRVRIDVPSSTVTLPVGLTLDPGGIGKGLAADLTVARLVAHGAAGALVSIGGDMAMRGRAPADDGWRVAVESPFDPDQELITLALDRGAVCTSSVLSRQWRRDGRHLHHLVDPRTQTTAAGDVAAVTVVAGAGWLAEVHATAALLSDDHALDHLDEHGLTGVVTWADGHTHVTSDLLVESPT